MVVSVAVVVSKDEHNCFIISSEDEALADAFIIPNGFNNPLQGIQDHIHYRTNRGSNRHNHALQLYSC